MASLPTQQSESDEYKMDHKDRGHTIIFNMKDFPQDTRNLSRRDGTDEDAAAMKSMFESFGFKKVDQFDNLKAQEMKDEIDKAAAEATEDISCFVCVILSHGEKHFIEAYDESVAIRHLILRVCEDKCKAWKGKPKIFIIQSCQGHGLMFASSDKIQGGTDMQAEGEAVPAEKAVSENLEIPTEPDLLVALSTVPGFLSFKVQGEGSWFIQTIKNVMDNTENRKNHDLLSMLTEVNHQVARLKNNNSIKQMPYFTSTLSKKVFFRPEA